MRKIIALALIIIVSLAGCVKATEEVKESTIQVQQIRTNRPVASSIGGLMPQLLTYKITIDPRCQLGLHWTRVKRGVFRITIDMENHIEYLCDFLSRTVSTIDPETKEEMVYDWGEDTVLFQGKKYDFSKDYPVRNLQLSEKCRAFRNEALRQMILDLPEENSINLHQYANALAVYTESLYQYYSITRDLKEEIQSGMDNDWTEQEYNILTYYVDYLGSQHYCEIDFNRLIFTGRTDDADPKVIINYMVSEYDIEKDIITVNNTWQNGSCTYNYNTKELSGEGCDEYSLSSMIKGRHSFVKYFIPEARYDYEWRDETVLRAVELDDQEWIELIVDYINEHYR